MIEKIKKVICSRNNRSISPLLLVDELENRSQKIPMDKVALYKYYGRVLFVGIRNIAGSNDTCIFIRSETNRCRHLKLG